ncbi:MAG: hypothetical protein RLZZ458_1237 [Planctomycetota bacterium]
MVSHLLQKCVGARPDQVFEDFFPDGVVALQLSLETRRIWVATSTGRLSLLSYAGDRIRESYSLAGLRLLAAAHADDTAVAVRNEASLLLITPDLKPEWESRATGRITSLAFSPAGGHLAFATDSCRIHIMTSDRRELARIETRRPVEHLQFLCESPHLLAATELGQLSRYDLAGKVINDNQFSSQLGDLAVSEAGRRIFLAAFNHGVQVCDLDGNQLGLFAVDGIPSRVACSVNRERIAVWTMEQRLFWMTFDGTVLWAADMAADPLLHLAMPALGDSLIMASRSGCLLNACWG